MPNVAEAETPNLEPLGAPAVRRPSPAIAWPILLLAVLTWLVYRDTFHDWWGIWSEPGGFYAHAAFVPFFSAVMIYRNREALARAAWAPSWWGAAVLLPAVALVLLGKHSAVTLLASFSFVLLLFAVSLMLFGVARTKIMAFPLLFIVTMVPLLPDQIINRVAFPIQLRSMQMATAMLNLLTLHARNAGTTIIMDSYRMAVEGQCSGFRTLVSLLTFSAAFAYLVNAQPWKRWTLFLVTAPLSLCINALRITFIGIVGELISKSAAQTFHDYSGFIVLLLAFIFLFNFAKLLNCSDFMGIPLQDEPATGSSADAITPPPPTPPADRMEGVKHLLAWRPRPGQMSRAMGLALVINVALLGVLAVQGKVTAKVVALPPIATTQVPMQFTAGGITYTAARLSDVDKLDRSTQDQLHPTRVINRLYDGSDGSHLTFFMTAGNARWTFHDPHNCSLGSDAQLNDVGVTSIPTPRGNLNVQESRYQRNGDPQLNEMMFCYVVNGDVLQRTEQVHKRLILQSVIGDSGRPSYFLRFTLAGAGIEPEQRAQLMRFIAGMWDQISPVLSGKAAAIAEPPPVPVPEQ